MVVRKTRRSHWVALSALIVLVAGLGSGCDGASSGSSRTGGPTGGASSPAASTSSTTSEDPRAAAAKAAVTAYQGYISAYAAASQIPDPDYPGLSRYVNQPLLSRTKHALRSMRDRGQVQVGAQTATVKGTSVDLAGSQPSATIHACLDYSALQLVYTSNHSPVPNSQIKSPKVSAIVTVWLFANGQWMVTDTKDGTDSC
jgi:hypothetical protein